MFLYEECASYRTYNTFAFPFCLGCSSYSSLSCSFSAYTLCMLKLSLLSRSAPPVIRIYLRDNTLTDSTNCVIVSYFSTLPQKSRTVNMISLCKGLGINTQPSCNQVNYSTMLVTTPDPTVLPPSLIANLNPSSIATWVINSTFISMWSPGITISIPSGNLIDPVTSVVLK